MPVRMIHTVSRAEPYVFQPAVMAALAVLAVALLLREGRWLEGRALMKKRPWQNWFLVAEAAVDAAFFLVAFGIFLLGSTLIGWEGMPSQLISEALGLLLGGLAIKGALLYCLLRTRRAGLVFALLSGPIALPWLLALVTPAPLLMPVRAAYVIFQYYCVLCRGNRLYSWPPMLPGGSPELSGLSARFNRYDGLRAAVVPPVIGGPDPAAIIPPPAERELTAEEALEAARLSAAEPPPPEPSDEPYDPGTDPEPILVMGPLDDAERPILPEERALWARYRAHETLEPCAVTALLEPDALPETVPDDLLAGSGLPRFLRDDARLRKLVRRCWREALADLRGYAEPPRGGTAAGETRLSGKNRAWLVLRLQENPVPPHRAEAELHLNE